MIDEDYIACVQSQIEMLKVDRDNWKTKFELLKRENDEYKEYNPNSEHETTTFKYVRAVLLCTVEVYTCSNCERYVCHGENMDFNYCPYCGKPVAEE